MYTVVQKSDIPGHRRKGDRPSLQVIDHRTKVKNDRSYEDSYETLRRQKEALQDAEIRYQKRIRELEREAAEYAKAQEATNSENKSLKNFVNRGPKAATIKKAKKENMQLQEAINKLHEENKDLVMLINRMEKREEEDWRDAFEETRMRQEQRYSVVGPFVAGLNGKKTTITLNDIPSNKPTDDYDKQLERLAKQAKTLYNKFEQMKRVKGSIDYATVMGTKMWTQNVHKHRAIADRVNMDLNKYSSRLNELTSKHEKMTDALITSLSSRGSKKPRSKGSASKSSERNNSQQTFMTELPDIEEKALVANREEEHADTESRPKKNNFRNNSNKTKVQSSSRNKPQMKGKSETVDDDLARTNTGSTYIGEDDNREKRNKENNWNGHDKSKMKISSPSRKEKNGKRGGKDEIPDDTYHAKPVSSANSRGILRGQDDANKKDENVKFQNQYGTVTKSRIEETWDQQREKMKESQIRSRRPASKSASTIRKKAVDKIMVKSDLGHYGDSSDEEMPIISRNRKKKEKVYSDRNDYKTNRTAARSPLVYEHAIKEVSKSNRRKSSPDTDMERIDDLPLIAPRQRKMNNYVNGDGVGRYSNGPEPTTETKRLFGNLEGPDPKYRKIRSKIDTGVIYKANERTERERKTSEADADAVELGKYNRRESKGSVHTKALDSRIDARSAKSSAKSPRTFPKHPPISKDSVHLEKEPNSKAVLHYLKHNTGGSPMDFTERFMDKEEKVSSPLPLSFRDDARTLRQRNVRFVSHAEQMRSEVEHRRGQFYKSYLRTS